MRLPTSPFTRSNFLLAKKMHQQGMSLGSLLMWPLRSRIKNGPYVFKLKQGVSFLTPRDLNFQLLWREIWVEEAYAQAGVEIGPEATVIDIGANIGLFSFWATTRTRRRVIAVEPSPRTWPVAGCR